MGACVRIQTGEKEPIGVIVVDIFGQPLIGQTNIKVKIRRLSDGLYYDWGDDTFKTYGAIAQFLQVLAEVSDSYWKGEYILDSVGHPKGWDTSKITNPVIDDIYHVTAVQDGGGLAANLPQVGEIKTGRWVDLIDVPVSDAATPTEVYTEAERVIRDYGLDHLVSVNPGIVPPAAGTYIRQILDKEDSLLLGGDVCDVKQSYAYDPVAEKITGQVWVEKNNQVMTAPTAVTVTWYDADGTAMFVMTDSAPDAQGVFKVTKDSPGLVRNRSYYMIALLNLPVLGTITSGKGTFTIG